MSKATGKGTYDREKAYAAQRGTEDLTPRQRRRSDKKAAGRIARWASDRRETQLEMIADGQEQLLKGTWRVQVLEGAEARMARGLEQQQFIVDEVTRWPEHMASDLKEAARQIREQGAGDFEYPLPVPEAVAYTEGQRNHAIRLAESERTGRLRK